MTVSHDEAREIVRARFEPNRPDDFGTFCIDDREITENDELYVFRIGAWEFLIEDDISYAIIPGAVPAVYKRGGRVISLPHIPWDQPVTVSRPNPSPALFDAHRRALARASFPANRIRGSARTLHVYLVDLAEVRAVIGSHDEQRLSRVLAAAPAASLGNDDRRAARSEQALRAIFAGGPFTADFAEYYIDALESICDELSEDGGEVEFRLTDPHLPFAIECLATNLTNLDPFPDIPGLASSFNRARWNGWGHLSNQECASELEQWANYIPGDDDLGDHLVEWLRMSKAADKDLIGFWSG
ncbi:DUF7691 family protein [Nocardia sp. NPDC004415]